MSKKIDKYKHLSFCNEFRKTAEDIFKLTF